jgi:hypothetical protein
MGCESWDAGAIPAASTFSEHATTNARSHQIASNRAATKDVVTHDDAAESRQQAAPSVMQRPPRASESATSRLTDDADLGVVLAAWSEMPATVRASILTLVKAARNRRIRD